MILENVTKPEVDRTKAIKRKKTIKPPKTIKEVMLLILVTAVCAVVTFYIGLAIFIHILLRNWNW